MFCRRLSAGRALWILMENLKSGNNMLGHTHGQQPITTAKILCNRITYALARSATKPPAGGWLESRWHWYRYPFSLRNTVLWSPFLKAWFVAENESAIECMLRLPSYEPFDWVTPRAGDVILDLGSYVGPYSLSAASVIGPSGRVIALEPDETNRRQLERNLTVNNVANCTVVPKAAWRRSGRVGWQAGEQPVWHHVDDRVSESTVEAISVDDLVAEQNLDRVDWIKLDIEGGEVDALEGAKQTLRRFRPALFVEIHKTDRALRDLLGSIDYKVERESYDEPPDLHGWVLARSAQK
jgi:FkbM family methyltransferase